MPSRWLAWLGCLSLLASPIAAQILVNGQVFTKGLAIYDSPAPNSEMHAGSSFTIAVDISGNGKMSQPNFSTAGFDILNIFLVSSQTSLNLTVVTSPDFLDQEQGSTVKHYNQPIPTCVSPGSYNITLYELAHIGDVQYFSITSIPITIQNEAQSGPCSNTNQLQAQPQAESPPQQNPFLDISQSGQPVVFPQVSPAPASGPVPPLTLLGPSGMKSVPSVQPSATPSPNPAPSAPIEVLTVTLGPSGVQWPLTITPPGMTDPVVVEPSGYTVPETIVVSDSATVTETDMVTRVMSDSPAGDGTVVVVVTPTFTPTPVTVVFLTVNTITATSTGPEITSTYTTVETSYTTTTGVMGIPTGSADSNYAGFLPINADSAGRSLTVSFHPWTVLLTVVLLALR